MQFAIAGGVVLLAIDVLVMRDAGGRTSTRLGSSQGLPSPTTGGTTGGRSNGSSAVAMIGSAHIRVSRSPIPIAAPTGAYSAISRRRDIRPMILPTICFQFCCRTENHTR
jgi:hypothetical protein